MVLLATPQESPMSTSLKHSMPLQASSSSTNTVSVLSPTTEMDRVPHQLGLCVIHIRMVRKWLFDCLSHTRRQLLSLRLSLNIQQFSSIRQQCKCCIILI